MSDAPLNWADPVARLAALEAALAELVSGQAVQRIQFRDRDMWFHRADVAELRAEIGRAKAEVQGRATLTITNPRTVSGW